MKQNDNQLDRLFRAAARSPRMEVGAPSFKLEAQVLAGWRSLQPGEDMTMLIVWFRRAVACACLLMLLSLAWNYSDRSGSNDRAGETADAFSIADSAVTLALNQ
ncbi:hypothetical protein [Pedosphaera parvula]|uniref:Uncharacterized protein n=1 Tax=Pedosphaera parvula (strain Ellin514) TaxID=320771 RepID=B9XJL7_PEDPL|nr:hypothetical protein [Pedosphaera parvula]EEF59893.1 hypothetical protein Cflav_PD2697 [Pedosphaera parvula Ellin514]